MKKIVGLSMVCSCLLFAETIKLDNIVVYGQSISTKVENISSEDLKSADLAEALAKSASSVSLVRRSGIANDIILRGQKKDNINVLMDEAKIYGACPNRMDPATSHILSNNVANVQIIEGPYDVEHFGTLSGLVVAETKKPTKEVSGEVNLNAGSYGYKKASGTISGGNDSVRVLMSVSKEEGDQYEDGNGHTLSEQLDNSIASGVGVAGNAYAPSKKDMKAFEKTTMMSKVFINVADNQELRLGYTLNRSDNVLYPSTPMDADYDDSDIYTLGYSIFGLSPYSKELIFEAYKSEVDHPMSTRNRVAGATSYMTNHVTSDIIGAKLKNVMDLGAGKLSFGVDASKRNWDGEKYATAVATGIQGMHSVSIPDVDTKNQALFAKYEANYDNVNVQMGARLDDTSVKATKAMASLPATVRMENDYNALSANVLTTIKASDTLSYFIGFGKSSRVPDAKELYLGTAPLGDLDQTSNYEADLGFDANYDGYGFKTKLFYSVLKDYIYFNSAKYVNIDATIYGLAMNAYYDFSDALTLDYGLTYLHGKKDDALAGQSDTDLAEITPLKANIALRYQQAAHSLKTEMIAAKRWSAYDSNNGEQALPGYAVFNVKYNYKITKNFDITVGVDNIFDKSYAVSNTYKDLTLIAGGGDVMLLNEPGRYFYTNLKYTF
ncbi:MAG: TonB-dependent receptor [Sulfurospirillaceae bacterium]|nr:TonB-dependent receptor [Sulfurospirillaceae bacterium]